MSLTLRIENETRLADGGPLVFRLTGRRGADIGRDPYLDWTLPDPTRFVSGKHCEIRWADGGYVLSDVSTNGTFLNGSDRRMDGPHRLVHGDRIMIGNYIVVAEFDEDEGMRAPVQDQRGAESTDFWGGEGAAEPIDRSALVHRAARPVKADFLDWAVDVPAVTPSSAPPPPAAARPIAAPASADWDSPGGPGLVPTPARPMPSSAFAPPPPASPFDLPPPVAGAFDLPAAGAVWVDSHPSGDWAAAPPQTQAPTPARPSPVPIAEARPTPPPPPAADPVAPPPRAMAAPMPPPMPPAPAPVAAPPMAGDGGTTEFLSLIAHAAGIPPELLLQRRPSDLAQEIGAMLRIVVENMMALLAARSETKRVIRSSEHTMIGATGNNPLKFSPTAEEALRLMLGPPLRSYLNGHAALEEGFGDLANHQLRTFAAMQRALKILVEDIDPETIDKACEPEHGLGSFIGSRKGRLWDQFVTRWQAKTMRHDDGMVGLFMLYFSEMYDRLGAETRNR